MLRLLRWILAQNLLILRCILDCSATNSVIKLSDENREGRYECINREGGGLDSKSPAGVKSILFWNL